MRDIHSALHDALLKYEHRITAAQLSKLSGVTESKISKFRHGACDIKVNSLNRIINALPSEVRKYFIILLLDWDLFEDFKGEAVNVIISQLGIVLSAAGETLSFNAGRNIYKSTDTKQSKESTCKILGEK